MFKLFALCLLSVMSFSANAATTTANPFKLDVVTIGPELTVSGELYQSCRFEMLVFGDSAEYQTEFKTFPLVVSSREKNNQIIHTLELKSKMKLSLTGIFKYGKECVSKISIKISDTRYAIGWGNKLNTPISFSFDSGSMYDYESGFSRLDLNEVESFLDNKVFSFKYKTIDTKQVNIWLLANDEMVSSVLPTTSAQDVLTKMPYTLKKQD